MPVGLSLCPQGPHTTLAAATVDTQAHPAPQRPTSSLHRCLVAFGLGPCSPEVETGQRGGDDPQPRRDGNQCTTTLGSRPECTLLGYILEASRSWQSQTPSDHSWNPAANPCLSPFPVSPSPHLTPASWDHHPSNCLQPGQLAGSIS